MTQKTKSPAEVAPSLPSQVQLPMQGIMNMSSNSTTASSLTTASTSSEAFRKFTAVCADASDLISAMQAMAGLILLQDASKPIQGAATSINALCDRIEDCLGKMSELAEKIDLQAHASCVEIEQ